METYVSQSLTEAAVAAADCLGQRSQCPATRPRQVLPLQLLAVHANNVPPLPLLGRTLMMMTLPLPLPQLAVKQLPFRMLFLRFGCCFLSHR